VIDLGNDYAVVFKIESHNHPSAVEPFQGAATGVGGIIRDIFAMGARPIALLDSLRFGNLQPVAAIGEPNGDATPGAMPAEEAAAETGEAQGYKVDFGSEPKPYVFTATWMTLNRRPLFDRGPRPAARLTAFASSTATWPTSWPTACCRTRLPSWPRSAAEWRAMRGRWWPC